MRPYEAIRLTTKLYTEGELDALRSISKRVTNPRAHWLEKPKVRPAHRQRSFQLVGTSGREDRFLIYQRQNLLDRHDFSCGIAYLPRGAPQLTLARYNGPSHEHGDISYRAHIHKASEHAIAAGRKAESDANETSRFESLEGALACLVEDYEVIGLNVRHDQQKLL